MTTCFQATVALNLLREKKGCFDLVISEVHMPDMDGFKLLQHIGLEMDLPVVLMSGDQRTSLVMRGIKDGACDYLIKPVRIEELQNIWQHVVRKKWSGSKDFEQSNVEENDQHRRGCDDAEYASSVNEGGVFERVEFTKGVPSFRHLCISETTTTGSARGCRL